jgi:hypothetical protein
MRREWEQIVEDGFFEIMTDRGRGLACSGERLTIEPYGMGVIEGQPRPRTPIEDERA